MPRSTNSPASRSRRKRVLLRAKGFRGFRSKLYRYAKDAVFKARQHEYYDRKKRKGQFRRLWIQRISAALTQCNLNYQISVESQKKGQEKQTVQATIPFTYSQFIAGLTAAGIEINRKALSEIAISDFASFQTIATQALEALKQQKLAS